MTVPLELRRWYGGEPGQCIFSRRGDSLFIERADPHIWVQDSWLRTLIKPEYDNPLASLMRQPYDLCDPAHCCQTWRGGPCFLGSILTITGVNQTVMYRIGNYLANGVWEGSWPD